jgi:hypothetical protein
MFTVRYGLPLAIFLLGIVFLVLEPNSTGLDGFCTATGAALALLLLNVLFRAGVAGDRDRDREEAAREYYDRHGHWPDEAGEAPELAQDPGCVRLVQQHPADRARVQVDGGHGVSRGGPGDPRRDRCLSYPREHPWTSAVPRWPPAARPVPSLRTGRRAPCTRRS